MKALVFHGAKRVTVDTVPDPKIDDPRDVILRVTSTAICGSDLHIYNGFFPQPRPMVLGHEFMGIVEEVGAGVTNLKVGDRVVVPFPIACGMCFFCQRHLPTHCEKSNPKNYGPEGGNITEKGAGLFGYTDLYGGYDGGQAQYVRVPFADYSPRKVPDTLTDEQVLFLTDIFPTGYAAVDWAQLKGGETVVVFGCGPVGIMAMKAAWLRGAARVIGVDLEDYRLAKARTAANAEIIAYDNKKNVVEKIRALTDGRGADVCIDAVGLEAHRSIFEKAKSVINVEMGTDKVLELCFSAARRGGTVTVVGVYGSAYDNFPMGQLFEKNLLFRGGQAWVQTYIDRLLQHVINGDVKLDDIISHRLPLAEAPHAYKIFCDKEDNCTKVVLKP